jgi:hypothetical protein
VARKSNDPPKHLGERQGVVGTYRAFDAKGRVLWECENFTAGKDKAPAGVSMSMSSMQIVDPESGEVLVKWNPWGAP